MHGSTSGASPVSRHQPQSPQHQRTISGGNGTPQSPVDAEMSFLAAQYESDKNGIIKSCFSKKDEKGNGK